MSLPVDTVEFWKKRIEDSKKYGDIHHSVYISNNTLWKKIEEAHKEILAPYRDKKVLDAGCGYGRSSQWFSPSGYVGVDLSPNFIGLAKTNYPLHKFECFKLEHLPYEDKEFDMAFCISIKGMVVGNLGISAWEAVEKELLRVAKEVLILEYENPTEFEVLHEQTEERREV